LPNGPSFDSACVRAARRYRAIIWLDLWPVRSETHVSVFWEQFFGDSEERIKTVVGLMLEAFENDDCWMVLKSIDDATRADVAKLAEALDEFGIVDRRREPRRIGARFEW
jgi:hypothetical protein